MEVDQKILKETIKFFIFLQPKTTSQKIKEYFELSSIKDFYILLQEEESLKKTISKFCTLADIEITYFRMIYASNRDHAIWKAKYDKEYREHKAKGY